MTRNMVSLPTATQRGNSKLLYLPSLAGSYQFRPLLLVIWAGFSISFFWRSSPVAEFAPSADTTKPDGTMPVLVSDDSKVPDYCHHFEGVLLISQGDRAGAAGTIFYLFIMNQLLYAEKHNLQPWIHLSSFSRHVYDPQVHGTGEPITYQFPEEFDLTWEYFEDPQIPDKKFHYPGKPVRRPQQQPTSIAVQGNGVWSSYFQSAISLQRGNQSFTVNVTRPCQNLPLLHLQSDQALVHGLHLNCPYCVRSWKYGGLKTGVPPRLREPADNYHQWWEPMRQTGHRMVSTYYHLQPDLDQLVAMANPTTNSRRCLAVHIRHSDKANRRTKIPLEAFLPYCQAFVTAGGRCIYLATDSSRVMDKIQAEWPVEVREVLVWQPNILRSSNSTAVFESPRHHRTNTEVLVDIAAMARCHWILHGLSAVSEAAIYTNPSLHSHSVNLEFYPYYKRRKHQDNTEPDAPLSVDSFLAMLQAAGLGDARE
jgi:hypothetical protein